MGAAFAGNLPASSLQSMGDLRSALGRISDFLLSMARKFGILKALAIRQRLRHSPFAPNF